MTSNKPSGPSRRTFLSFLGTLSIGTCWVPAEARSYVWQDDPVIDDPGNDAMDEALAMLAPYGASFRRGLSNHGPMTAEALVSLGHHDGVVDWVESYRGRLEPRPEASEPIDKASWRGALGDKKRSRDWDDWFTRELAESPWREVVGRWVPRLAPGIAAAGLHGVIRVGHAVCALNAKENALRLDELARALGYWAAEFMVLPGEPAEGGKLAPSLALAKIPRLPDDQRTSRGLITTEMSDLIGYEPFTKVVDLVDTSAGDPSFMSDLLATFAGTFVNTDSGSFEFLHAVTGTAAVAELLPLVHGKERDLVRAYAWQVTAGIYSRYSRESLVAEVEPSPKKERVEELARLAVETGDAHTIKLLSSCRREWLRNADPRVLAAAAKRIAQSR